MWVTRFGYNSVISGPNLKILSLLWSWELILGHDWSHNRLQTVNDQKRPVTSGSVRFFPFLEFSVTGVTTQRRLCCAQPPRCVLREFSGMQGCSHNLQLHSLGEKKIVFELTTSCTTCICDLRFLELKCEGLRCPRCPSPESGTRCNVLIPGTLESTPRSFRDTISDLGPFRPEPWHRIPLGPS
jgi:hypothetical protein